MLALAWPMVLTNLGQTAMNTTDVMMMGRLGPEALASGTLGSNLYFAPMMFGLGLILPVSPMVAFEIGRNRHSVRDVRRTVRQGFWIACMVVVPLWLFLWHTEEILLAMGQEPELAAGAGVYMRSMQWSILPFYGFIVLRSFISALERPGWALVIVFAAVGFNALSNYCLMFGKFGFPALGLFGAGISTTLSATLMFAGMAIVVTRHRVFRRYRLFGRFWRPDWPRFWEMLRIGLPIAGILVFEVAVFGASGLLMGLIDTTSLAAHAIALQIGAITFMVPMGLGQAATVRVGRFHGAGDRESLGRAGWTALAMGLAFMAMTAIAMITVPRLLIMGFIDISDPANAPVVAKAITFLSVAAVFQLADGAQAVGSGMLRGLRDTRVPMLYAAIGYWAVGLPLGAGLAFWGGFAGVGIWIGLATGLAVVGALLIGRWIRRERLLGA